VPASVIGPVNGPRSASTSLSARVAGRRRSVRGCVPRAEGELACVSLRRGLAMSRSYRVLVPNLPSQDISQSGSNRDRQVVVLTARERAAEAGAAALRPFASARLRASVLRQSGPPTLLAGADNRSKVHSVEAQCGPRRKHEVVTAMDKPRCLERGKRVDHVEPAANLRHQLLNRPYALAATQQESKDALLGTTVLLFDRLVRLILHRKYLLCRPRAVPAAPGHFV
jgi:hypothetical protein